jgi:hypothetical protein
MPYFHNKFKFIIYEKKLSTNVKISYEQNCGAGSGGSGFKLPPGAGSINSKLRIRIRKLGIRPAELDPEPKEILTGSATLVLRMF